jgi:predicted DNA-binding antitoxin AbrB/MazE fold protein
LMDVVEAIYEDGVLRVLNPSKIESDLITVEILNLEEVLSGEEEDLLEEALSEREKGRYHTFEEVLTEK